MSSPDTSPVPQDTTPAEPLSVRPHDDGMSPPAWEVVTAWGGVLAVVFPEPIPCPLSVIGSVDAERYAHLIAAASQMLEALEAFKRAEQHDQDELYDGCDDDCDAALALWAEAIRLRDAAIAAARPAPTGDGAP